MTMKIYKVVDSEDTFFVLASTTQEAIALVGHEYFDDDPPDDLQIDGTRTLRKGLVVHFDNEDLYFYE